MSDIMIKKIKADVIAVGCVLLAAAMFFCILYFMDSSDAEAVIMQEGNVVGKYPLLEDRTISVSDDENGYNLVLISNGQVRVCDADCPDKLCVKQKSISKGGESIICLPHKLVVQIISKEESDLDAVTN